MLRSTCFLVLLFFHHRANGAPAECEGLPDSSQIEQRLDSWLADVNGGGGDPSAGGTVVLNAFYPACIAQGSSSGTYREYSVVADYSTVNEANAIRLFDLECQILIQLPTWEAAGISQLTDPGFQFMTIEPRNNCSGCSMSAGNDFNCEACNPACDDGLMRCTGTGSNDCCAAFQDGDCIPTTTCSETNFVANEESNFVCVCSFSQTGCPSGFSFNSTDCSCNLADICMSQPPPCSNNGSCVLNMAPDNFTCDCTGTGFTGDNCTECGLSYLDCADGYTLNSAICSCELNDICVADNPCTNGVCELVSSPDQYTCNCTGTNYMGTLCSVTIVDYYNNKSRSVSFASSSTTNDVVSTQPGHIQSETPQLSSSCACSNQCDTVTDSEASSQLTTVIFIVTLPLSVLMSSVLTGLASVLITVYFMRRKYRKQNIYSLPEPTPIYDTPLDTSGIMEMSTNQAYGQVDCKN